MGILIRYLYFLQYQNTELKINTPENHKSLSLCFFFQGGSRSSSAHAGLDLVGLAGSLAQASDPTGQTRGMREFPHACMLSYYSSEL